MRGLYGAAASVQKVEEFLVAIDKKKAICVIPAAEPRGVLRGDKDTPRDAGAYSGSTGEAL